MYGWKEKRGCRSRRDVFAYAVFQDVVGCQIGQTAQDNLFRPLIILDDQASRETGYRI